MLPPITLRLYTPDDAEAAFAIYSDPEVMKYLGSGAVEESVERLREKLVDRAESIAQGAHPRMWAVCLPETGQVIGTGIYGRIPLSKEHGDDPEEWEVGWHLARAWWGKGYGTAIAKAMLAKAGEDRRPVVAVAFPENTPSIRIMEKAGMTVKGPTDRYYNFKGLVLAEWNPPSP